MYKYLNSFPEQNNIKNINNNVNQIQKLTQNGYFQINQNNRFSSKNSYSAKESEANNIKGKNNLNDNFSKSFNKINSAKEKNISNNRKIVNYNRNNCINTRGVTNIPSKIQENEYIFSLAMNNLNKYSDNLVLENNPQVSNQFNNKKFINNIINYCLIKPNNGKNKNNENFLHDIENEKVFPLPEPTPIKISKSSNNIIKNFPLKLNTNIQRNNGNNIFNHNKYCKSTTDVNNNYGGYDSKNYLNNIQNDYYENNLNSHYNKTASNAKSKIFCNNLDENNINSINVSYNNYINNDNDKLMFILNNLKLSYLINVFKNNYITFDDLFLLTREDLVEMKIPIGPRNKLINFITEYKNHMKNFEFEELSNYFLYYNNNSIKPEQKIMENNIPSTTQTTNEFSYRIKGNSNNFKSNEKKEVNLNNYVNNNISNYNNKDNYNMSKNCSLLNSSYNYMKTSLQGNSINNKKRNSSCLNIFKTSSLSDSNIPKKHKNNSVICKEKKIRDYNSKEKQINKEKNEISLKINNETNNSRKNNNRTRPNNNNKFHLRNPLMKLIEDSQSDKTYKTYSIISGQILNQNNSNDYQQDNINYYDNSLKFSRNKEIINDSNYNMNNNIKVKVINEKKKKDKNYYKKNKTKLNIVNLKMKNNTNNSNISQNLSNKIVENYKSLYNEVENFQNHYKKLKKASYERDNKLKSLLIEDRHSSVKIKYLKQQLKNLNFNLEDLKSEYEKDLNAELEKKKNNKNLVLKNICQLKNNNISCINNNNISNSKNNTLIYELNLENDK